MDCERALEELAAFLDRELAEGAGAELEQHLRECRDCFSRAAFERRLRALVRRSCGGDRIPLALERRLRRLLKFL